MNRKALAEAAVLVFFVAVCVLNALTLTLTYKAEQSTQTLLTNGKTTSAQNSAAAKKSAAEGEKIIQHVENQLDSIIASSWTNRALICSIAITAHVSSPIIVADCAKP
jgi:hypothetical protein